MILREFDTCIFDLDGVLIDSLEDIGDAVNHILVKYGKQKMSYNEIKSYIGKGGKYLLQRSFASKVPVSDEIYSSYLQFYGSNCAVKTTLRKGTKELLDKLDKKNLAVLSNKSSWISKLILNKSGVADRFGIILGPEDLERMKPDPEGILRILEKFKSPNNKAIIFGDSYSDIETGKNAGILTCGVLGGIGDEKELIKACPDFMIRDFTQLL